MPPKPGDNKEQNISVKTAKNGISFDQYKNMLINHYSRHRPEVQMNLQQMQERYNTISDEELIKEYDELLNVNRPAWQRDALDSGIMPKWVLNTGNADAIYEYINENHDNLTYEQQFFLRYRAAVAAKVSKIKTESKDAFDKGEDYLKLAEVEEREGENGEKSYELKGVHQKAFQNTGNGCWSCFFQVLSSSRGVNVTQEEIRENRPNLIKEEAEKLGTEAYKAFNHDQANSALEMGDCVLGFMPNTMLCEMEIAKYGYIAQEKGITQEQYVNRGLEQIKNTIIHAIRDEHSPVGVLLDGHYITIVGIDGDKIKYKDSDAHTSKGNGDPDYTHESTLAEEFGGLLKEGDGANMALQFTYAKEIKLSKDGKTIFGVPSEFSKMMPDGSVAMQPSEIRNGAHLPPKEDPEENINGVQVARYGRVEDTYTEQVMRETLVNGVFFTEKAYVPKQLDAQYLIKKAQARSIEEENELRKQDEANYGNKRPAVTKAEADLDKMLKEAGKSSEDDRFIYELSNELDTFQRERRATERLAELNEEAKRDGVQNGFAKIRSGDAYNEIYKMQLMTNRDFKLENLDDAEASRCKEILIEVMGSDRNNTEIGIMFNVYDKFTYKSSPDVEPVNVVEDVKQKLTASGKFGNPVKEGVIYKFAAAELIRLASNPSGELKYENGDFSTAALKIRPALTLTPKDRITNVNNPVNDDDRRLAFDIEKLDIPRVKDEGLYNAVVGLSSEQVDAYEAVYDKIFGKGEGYDPSQLEININLLHNQPRMDTSLYNFRTVYMQQTEKAAYNPDFWNKKQKLPNGEEYEGPLDEDIVKLEKAIVIMAMANGMPVKKDRVPVGVLENSFKATDKKRDITEAMTAEDIEFFGDPGAKNIPMSYKLEDIRNSLNTITAAIEGADTKYFRSSGYYRDVKRELKKLNQLIEVTFANKQRAGEPITFEDMEKFFEKSENLRAVMIKYLDHKKKQMEEDPARRTKASKQSHEQNRIKTMLDSMGNLDRLTDKVERSVLKGMSAGARQFINAEYEKAVNRAKDIDLSGDKLTDAYAVVADRVNQLDDDFYSRQRKFRSGKETLREARDRIVNAVNAKYDGKFFKKLHDKKISPVYQTATLAAGTYEKKDHKRMKENDLKKAFKTFNAAYKRDHFYDTYDKDVLKGYSSALLSLDTDRLQMNTNTDVTVVPYRYTAGIRCVENVFGIKADMKRAFGEGKEIFTKEEAGKLKDINGSFKPVGEAAAGYTLSGKDFAAIAFAAAMTDRVFAKVDPKLYENENADIARFKFNAVIPFGFSANPVIDAHIGDKYADAVQESRLMAVEAMNAYANDKKPLAQILAKGLSEINALFKADCFSLSGADIEMAARMKNMLERDPELKALAMENGLEADDMEAVDKMHKLLLIKENADVFAEKTKLGLPMTESELTEGITDTIMIRILEEQKAKSIEARYNGDAAYRREYEGVYNSLVDEIMGGNPDKVGITGRMKDAQDQLNKKYPVSGAILDKLTQKGFIEELRSTVHEMVSHSTFGRSKETFAQINNVIKQNWSYSDYMLNYKKAPKTGNGLYSAAALTDSYLKAPANQAKLEEQKKLNAENCCQKSINKLTKMIDKEIEKKEFLQKEAAKLKEKKPLRIGQP